ncbi:hypothetical protein [Deinococcus hohokamensis]|uniref:Uncharacterized protein n=1 Tax=Deinococcus hohokamensis TaxID=309883 RepID=A0ABV9I3U1_9DEIO
MTENIFSGVDWHAVAFASGVGVVWSLVLTWRARNAQALRNLPLTPWRTVLPDTVVATFTGTVSALFVPTLAPALKTFAGVALLAMGGAAVGPKLWAFVSRNGFDTLIDFAASSASGPLQKLAQAAAKRKDGDPQHESQPLDAPPAATKPDPEPEPEYEEDPASAGPAAGSAS